MIHRVPINRAIQGHDNPELVAVNRTAGRTKRFGCLFILAIVLAFAFIGSIGAAAAFELLPWQASHNQTLRINSPVCGTWAAQTLPGAHDGGLEALAVISPSEVWAVGSKKPIFGVLSAFIERWDGKTWTEIDEPSQHDSKSVILHGIAALSSTDVWVVGQDTSISPTTRSIIEHWDGKQWSIVPSPNPGIYSTILFSVAVSSQNDVWAVGDYQMQEAHPSQALILHWDGTKWTQIGNLMLHWDSTKWTQIGNPPMHDNAKLRSVTAIGPNNVWAVGSYGVPDDNTMRTLIMHWDGSAWSPISSPSLGKSYNVLEDVAATSPNDVWAVGIYNDEAYLNTLGIYYDPAYADNDRTMTLHWDGNKWSAIQSPNGNLDHDNALFALAAISKDDVWAVGDQVVANEKVQDFGLETLVMHWDGKQWSIVPSPALLDFQGLYAVGVLSPNEILAVGEANNYERAENALVARISLSDCAKSVTTNTP